MVNNNHLTRLMGNNASTKVRKMMYAIDESPSGLQTKVSRYEKIMQETFHGG